MGARRGISLWRYERTRGNTLSLQYISVADKIGSAQSIRGEYARRRLCSPCLCLSRPGDSHSHAQRTLPASTLRILSLHLSRAHDDSTTTSGLAKPSRSVSATTPHEAQAPSHLPHDSTTSRPDPPHRAQPDHVWPSRSNLTCLVSFCDNGQLASPLDIPAPRLDGRTAPLPSNPLRPGASSPLDAQASPPFRGPSRPSLSSPSATPDRVPFTRGPALAHSATPSLGLGRHDPRIPRMPLHSALRSTLPSHPTRSTSGWAP